MSPKLHLSGCLACFLSDIPARLSTQMEIHLLLAPPWLFFFSFSIPNPIPPLSGACLPAEVLYLAACLSDSLSFSCGCSPPSVAVTANRHAIGPFQLMILSLGLNYCCSVNPLPHSFFFSRQISWSLLFFVSSNHADVTDVQNRQTYLSFYFSSPVNPP